MAATIITLEDLQHFKQELLAEIRQIFKQTQDSEPKKRLKSNEVKELLSVSSGTIQNLRANGTLPFTKIGGGIFYDYEDIQKMMEEHKRSPRPNGDTPNP